MASFCKSCQANNVDTRIEWRPNPDKPGKKKQFDIDKQEWHNCKYWKPDPNYRKPKLKPEDQAVFDEFEKGQTSTQAVSLKDIANSLNILTIEHQKNMTDIKRLLSEFGEAIAKMSFEKASKLK